MCKINMNIVTTFMTGQTEFIKTQLSKEKTAYFLND